MSAIVAPFVVRIRLLQAVWALSLSSLILGSAAREARAQGPTTAAIGGRIIDSYGLGVQDAEVVVTSRPTGITLHGFSREDGRYLVSGLEVGGPYTITVRRIGLPMQTRTGLFLSLGQELQVEFDLGQRAVALQAIEVRAEPDSRVFSRTHTGTSTLLSDSAIHQMPVINRDIYDLVRLVPQMSTWFALAAAGGGSRSNSIRIDGVGDQVTSSNFATGQLYGGKVIPLDAVKEYQVLLSPFDVRQGSFAGASVNVVTRSGSNDFHGSAFAYGTNERLGPDVPFVRNARYEKEQVGLFIGGPVVRDELLFFLSTELQQREIPALGPSADGSISNDDALPVAASDIKRFQQLLSSRGLDAGSAGPVSNANPSSSTFLRFDAPIARWNSRFTVRGTYGHADSSIFARPTMLAPTNCPTADCFPLSSLQHSRWVDKEMVTTQLISNFASAASNELLAGYDKLASGFRPTVKQPLILVTVPGVSGVPAVLQAGTHEIATGQRNASWTAELSDNLSFFAGTHRITLGGSSQLFDLRAFQLRGSYGIWEFASLDSLAAAVPSHYRITRDTGSVTAASGAYHGVYIGDEWEASPRLSLTLGVRGDLSMLSARPPYVSVVDSVFHLRTDKVPSGIMQWSPRFGFNYSLTNAGDARSQVRGGAGLFTGRPPLFWLFGGFAAYGLASRTLQCGSLSSDAGPAPSFSTDYENPPLSCAGGQTFGGATNGEVDVIAPRLRYPQNMRTTLALDKQLSSGFSATIEALYTRAASAVFFAPLNLLAPAASDRHGRLMYGTVASTGVASPTRVTKSLGDVIEIGNESRDHAYDVTGELRRQGRIVDATASLSYGRSHDVQSPRTVSALLTDNWRFGRPVSGREDDLGLGTSDFDQPLRVHLSGTLRSPWRRFSTEMSFFYIGGTGFPFTYVAGGAGGRGDLNADGAVGNDPIYIPRSAYDTTEIRFAGTTTEVATQQDAFERFVDGAACLRSQRGQIMSRNSCRAPWISVTNLALRQAIPSVNEQSMEIELQVFNLLNLLNPRWGKMELPTGAVLASSSEIPLLSQVAETTGAQAQPIYRFDSTMRRYNADNFDTYYQFQLAVRYNF